MAVSLLFLKEQFLDWTMRFRRQKTFDNYKRYLDRFCTFVGDIDVSQLKAFHLLQWGKTWHELQAVQRFLSWAHLDAELCDRNPFRRVKRPPIGKRRRIFDSRTLARVLRKAGREFRCYLLVLRETLARPQEVRALAWQEIVWPEKPDGMEEALQLGRAVFLLEEYKARDRRLDPDAPRVIPITPRLGRLLARLARRSPARAGAILQNRLGKAWTNNAVRLRMRSLRRRLGLAADHRGENIVAYTLRHTLATWATAAGVRDRILADLLGHTSTRTTARYQHLEVEHLVEALQMIHSRRAKQARRAHMFRAEVHPPSAKDPLLGQRER